MVTITHCLHCKWRWYKPSTNSLGSLWLREENTHIKVGKKEEWQHKISEDYVLGFDVPYFVWWRRSKGIQGKTLKGFFHGPRDLRSSISEVGPIMSPRSQSILLCSVKQGGLWPTQFSRATTFTALVFPESICCSCFLFQSQIIPLPSFWGHQVYENDLFPI